MRKAASHSYGFLPTLLVACGALLIVFTLVFVSKVYAWSTQQSAETYCESGCVKIRVSFKNTEPTNSGLSMRVVATDEQTSLSTDLGVVAPGETKTGVITTSRTQLNAGRVRFNLTWGNGQSGTDVRYASYSAKECAQPTPVPTQSPVPTVQPTVVPTVHPTIAPTVAPTIAPTVQPTVVPTIQPTVAPTTVPTTQPTTAPTSAPTDSPVVRTDLTDNRSDNSKDALDCVPESKHGRKSCNDSQGVVAGVSTDRSLPSTGDTGSIFAVISVFAAIAGVYVKFISDRKEKKLLAEYEKNRKVVYAQLG